MKTPLWLHQLWQRIRSLILSTPQPLYRGIDVSEHNGRVDFQALRGKIDFAILRCGYGSDYSYQDDACFLDNVKACNEAKIPYGVYLYAYAKDTKMAQSEAAHAIRLIKGTDPAFGVWYDVEDASLPYGDTLVSICETWCDAILAAGITCVGIYASLSVMDSKPFKNEKLNKYEKWVAQWNDTCEYPNPGMWQFTDQGKLNGQRFDMNYAYKDYPDITGASMTPEQFDKMMQAWLDTLDQKGVDDWAKEPWNTACEMKVFDGTGPRSFLTREQAAVVFDHLHLLKKQP